MSSPAVDALVERCRSLSAVDLPAPVARATRHSLLDGFGLALAGAQTELASLLRRTVGGRSGECTILGSGDRVAAADAALLNGAAIHALDFDDLHPVARAHLTATVLPAVLALAEQRGDPQQSVLAAYVAGVEVAAAVGSWVNPAHYDRGWHATGTVGTIGAAAACAHLLGLEADEWTTALALAATQAAGVRGTFGSMAKPLHAGRAAASGLLSARLAAEGFTCARGALDGPTGFLGIHGDLDQLGASGRNGREWAVDAILFKFHTACYMTHAGILNARALVAEHGVEPAEIDSIEVHVAPELEGVCDIAEPQEPLEGKFSLQLTTALGIVGADTADEDAFSREALSDATVRDLCRRVTVTFSPELDGQPTRARTQLMTRSGALLAAEHDTGEPERDLDAREEKLVAKFRSLARKVLDADAVAALEEEILRCPSGSIAPALRLAAAVRQPG